VGEALALSSALCFGMADFVGGWLSRRTRPELVGIIGQLSGLPAAVVAALVVAGPEVSAGSLLWGVLSGLGTGIGVRFLYRGMGYGRMSVVVPLSDVGGVALPVVAGVVLLGDRPSAPAWCGIVLALPALWFIAREGGDGGPIMSRGAMDGLVAGIGFAVQNIALGQVDPAAGLWPIVAGRVVAAATLLPGAVGVHGGSRMPLPHHGLAVLAGLLGVTAIVLYTLATRQQLLAVAVVLASLYPVFPVILGILLLGERMRATQVAGLAAAGAAVVLLAV
jgi:drug/metabolite transporter (DMT)-like permease